MSLFAVSLQTRTCVLGLPRSRVCPYYTSIFVSCRKLHYDVGSAWEGFVENRTTAASLLLTRLLSRRVLVSPSTFLLPPFYLFSLIGNPLLPAYDGLFAVAVAPLVRFPEQTNKPINYV